MSFSRFSSLRKRIPLSEDPYDSLIKAREYDLAARDLMTYPMERVISSLIPFCKDGMQLLNVGSETGLLSIILGGRNPGIEILGIEEHEFLFQVSEENARLASLCGSPAKVSFQQGFFSEFPIEDKSADVVLALNLFYRCSDPKLMLRECVRVCKLEGLVLLYELVRDADPEKVRFAKQFLKDGQKDFMRTLSAGYTKAEIRDMLETLQLGHWKMSPENMNVRITNRELFPKSLEGIQHLSLVAQEELMFLFRQAQKMTGKEGVIVDIGTLKGGTAICLALGSQSAQGHDKVYTIDILEGHSEERPLGQQEIEESTEELKNNLMKFGVLDQVVMLLEDSSQVVSRWQEPIKLLFYDGSTAYEKVKEMAERWAPFIIPGGLMLFHDYYYHDFQAYGGNVNKAIDEFVEENSEFKLINRFSQTAVIERI